LKSEWKSPQQRVGTRRKAIPRAARVRASTGAHEARTRRRREARTREGQGREGKGAEIVLSHPVKGQGAPPRPASVVRGGWKVGGQ